MNIGDIVKVKPDHEYDEIAGVESVVVWVCDDACCVEIEIGPTVEPKYDGIFSAGGILGISTFRLEKV